MFLLLSPPCLIAILLITLFFLFFLFHHSFLQANISKLPPGAFGWCPFIGQTLSFISPHVSFSRGRFLEDNIKRYGKIFRSHLFGYPTVVSCDGEFNQFILNNEGRLVVSSYPKNIHGVLEDLTLLVQAGASHSRLRAVALTFFSTMRTQVISCLSDIEESAVRVLDSWKGKKTVSFCDEARKFTFSVIVKQALSLGPEHPEAAEILKNLIKFMEGLVSMPIELPGTPYSKAIRANRQVKALVSTLIDQREKGEHKVIEGRLDFLDILLAHKNLSRKERVSLVLDILFGGYETTSSLISIIVRFLSDNPKALHALKDEHQSLRRKVGNERLGWHDYKEMCFTRCLINEGLRMGNVVKFVHRQVIKPFQYKGYDIPEGWKILPLFTAVHLDSSLYPDPFKFDPWRWQKEAGSGKNFMPFGGGPRLCPGSDIGRLQTSLFLHHLVLTYSWTPLDDSDVPMSFPYLEFKNGLNISIQPLPKSAST
ncbi:hypothetical protein J5N97_019325 [Dioscorea zingiberensis]|uniref:Cytochrome P450 n=1 Tax=Dioscorea zingiberensis TaxID=325984 RepID=A0A9D5CDT4_9LILI|nr:hypothetical protein J5N97_019325 [Dioscorea zingiberensis]